MTRPRVVAHRTEYERPWLSVEAKDVALGDGEPEVYYSVQTHDYSAALAVTEDGRIPLVRQFRPAIERVSLELPSGLVEVGEDPAATIERELVEEAGCEAGPLELIGRFDLDSGRMQTVQWAYFAPSARLVGAPSGDEPDLEVLFVTRTELLDLIRSGEFCMSGHLAVVGVAIVRGLLS